MLTSVLASSSSRSRCGLRPELACSTSCRAASMAERAGHRGYIGARPLNGSRTPQHVQNIVIRDYARRKNLQYLLSAAEHTMPGSYMILEDILDELPRLRGIICYSIFMLPPDAVKRREIYDRILREG